MTNGSLVLTDRSMLLTANFPSLAMNDPSMQKRRISAANLGPAVCLLIAACAGRTAPKCRCDGAVDWTPIQVEITDAIEVEHALHAGEQHVNDELADWIVRVECERARVGCVHIRVTQSFDVVRHVTDLCVDVSEQGLPIGHAFARTTDADETMIWPVDDLAGVVKLSRSAWDRISTGVQDAAPIRIGYSLTGEGGGSSVGRAGAIELAAADLERK